MNAEQFPRPLPHPTEISAPHWNGAQSRKLMVQRCNACTRYVFIPRRVCPHCLADALQWVQSSGRGKIYSYTIIHRAPDPSFQVPYCAAIVELEEGWHMMTNIVGAEMSAIAVDLPVVVDYLDVGEMTLPVFKLSTSP